MLRVPLLGFYKGTWSEVPCMTGVFPGLQFPGSWVPPIMRVPAFGTQIPPLGSQAPPLR